MYANSSFFRGGWLPHRNCGSHTNVMHDQHDTYSKPHAALNDLYSSVDGLLVNLENDPFRNLISLSAILVIFKFVTIF
jgi:hypothetical protein